MSAMDGPSFDFAAPGRIVFGAGRYSPNSPDGRRLYLSNVNGSIKVAFVNFMKHR